MKPVLLILALLLVGTKAMGHENYEGRNINDKDRRVWLASIWTCRDTPASCRRKVISIHYGDFAGCGKAVTTYLDNNFDAPKITVWGDCTVSVNDMIDSKIIPDYKNPKWCRYCT